MEEYRIDLKVRNNVILNKIENAGYKTLGEFCRLNNIMKYVNQLGGIISMKISPLTSDGEFRKSICHTAELLGCDPLDLFTDTQLHTILKSNKRSIQVNEAEMKFMIQQNDQQKLLENFVEDDQMQAFTEKALDRLTPREKKVIQMRFGLGEYDREYTLREISEKMGYAVSERARQIEAVAMRKLRHPSRSEDLESFIDDRKVLTEKEKELNARRFQIMTEKRSLTDYDGNVFPQHQSHYNRIQKELENIERILGKD